MLVSSVVVQLTYAVEYKDIREISLKKDVYKKILVNYGTSSRLFKFKWTLYVNEGLIVLRSYDKIVAQNILYLNNINQSFALNLKERGVGSYLVPYVLVKFKKFNYEKNEALFELFLVDKESQIQMEYLKDNE